MSSDTGVDISASLAFTDPVPSASPPPIPKRPSTTTTTNSGGSTGSSGPESDSSPHESPSPIPSSTSSPSMGPPPAIPPRRSVQFEGSPLAHATMNGSLLGHANGPLGPPPPAPTGPRPNRQPPASPTNSDSKKNDTEKPASSSSSSSTSGSDGSSSSSPASHMEKMAGLFKSHPTLAQSVDTALVLLRQAIQLKNKEALKQAIAKGEQVAASNEYTQVVQSSTKTSDVQVLASLTTTIADAKLLLDTLNSEAAEVLHYYIRQGLVSRNRETLKQVSLMAMTVDKSQVDRTLLQSAETLLAELDGQSFLAQTLVAATNSKDPALISESIDKAVQAGMKDKDWKELAEARRALAHIQEKEREKQAGGTDNKGTKFLKLLFGPSSSSSTSPGGMETLPSPMSAAPASANGVNYAFGASLTSAVSLFGVPVPLPGDDTSSSSSSSSSSPSTSSTSSTPSSTPEVDQAEQKTASQPAHTQSVPSTPSRTVSVPSVIADCVQHLMVHGLEEPGLFRLAGHKENMAQLVQGYELYFGKLAATGMRPSCAPIVNNCGSCTKCIADITSKGIQPPGNGDTVPQSPSPPQSTSNQLAPPAFSNVHDVATIIKQYLRSLPSPLIPYNQYPEWLALASKIRADSSCAQKITSTEAALANPNISSLKALVQKLPSNEKALLEYLGRFLGMVAAKSGVNKMTPDNIAIVFAPNFLRNANETAQSAMTESPLTIVIIAALIRHIDHLFT